MAGVIFFDIDGTLTSAAVSSSAAYLASLTGNTERVVAAEAAYARGELSNADVCVVDAAGFADVPVTRVEEWLDELPLIDGIAEVVDGCRERGLTPVLASLAWLPVSEALARRFRFVVSGGPELRAVDGVFSGEVQRNSDEREKRDVALEVAERLGVGPARCLAVGDSRSDLPLFREVGASIALNATPDCAAAADVAVSTTDLRDLLPVIDQLLLERGLR